MNIVDCPYLLSKIIKDTSNIYYCAHGNYCPIATSKNNTIYKACFIYKYEQIKQKKLKKIKKDTK